MVPTRWCCELFGWPTRVALIGPPLSGLGDRDRPSRPHPRCSETIWFRDGRGPSALELNLRGRWRPRVSEHQAARWHCFELPGFRCGSQRCPTRARTAGYPAVPGQRERDRLDEHLAPGLRSLALVDDFLSRRRGGSSR